MSKTILLVEDNESDEKLTLMAFKRGGLTTEIIVQRDGADAIDYLLGTGKFAGRDTSVMPVLVLLDINLPRIDGLDVLRRIRENDRTRLLPVVVLTSSREDEDITRSYSLGANGYVRKPVDFSEFAAAAKTLRHFWLDLNELPRRTRET